MLGPETPVGPSALRASGSSPTNPAYPRAYIRFKEVFTPVAYLFVILLILAGLVYVGLRMRNVARNARSKTRVIGPDDDPEFLWRLGRGDDSTKK
ncbi:MAG: hypothetical protein QOH57_3166 [Mycobacterium sp.]|jgi:hypothetical protein|nr:hypothetical protein [Mycobacterium sp.]